MAHTADNLELSFDPNDYVADPVEVKYRDALGDGLEIVLADGAETLDAVVDGLNSLNVSARSGARWTAESLETELRRLAP